MDMTGIDWTPIRMHWVDVDGQGHTVSNLNCGIDDWGRSGFVGYAGGANIKNITLKNVTAEGTQVGIVMGSAEGFMLENVKIEGTNSVKYNKLKNPKETCGGAGAVGGIASYANAASSVEIVSGARVTVDYNGLLTEAPIQNEYAQSQDISAIVTDNGTVTEIGEPTKVVKVEESAGKNAIANATASALANGENVTVELGAGEYTLPTDRTNTGSEITIKGTKDTVIDATGYTYLDNHKLSVEGVTINSRFAQVGSDYTAIYAPNATFTNCTINGAMLVGRDGVKFIGCTFNVTEDYIRTYGNDVTFENCTFNTIGKAILVYSDGNGMNTAPAVTVTGCTFKASQKGFAGAITNQACAAIEIDNYGCGVTLTTSGNTIDGNFSGIWRIKTYDTNKTANKVIANGTEYTSLAIDGKTMTINGKEVTVNN